MASSLAKHIDLDRALAPIPGDAPAGPSLAQAETFRKIEVARREEDDLPQGIWVRERKIADWVAVERLCVESLERHSKDLHFTAWLTEAWLRQRGVEGLADGLELTWRLIEATNWEVLHPRPSPEDDPEEQARHRLMPIRWVSTHLALPVRLVPLVGRRDDGVSLADWDSALRLSRLREKDSKAYEREVAEGARTPEVVLALLKRASLGHLAELSEALTRARAELGTLERIVESRVGGAAPSFSQLRGVIDEIEQLLRQQKLWPNPQPTHKETMPEQNPPGSASDGASLETHVSTATIGPIHSRSDAYRRLAEAADYLLDHEPHSPTAYLIKRAVSWEHLSLDRLLNELIADSREVAGICKMLGIASSP